MCRRNRPVFSTIALIATLSAKAPTGIAAIDAISRGFK
jgi:hypothetical protein